MGLIMEINQDNLEKALSNFSGSDDTSTSSEDKECCSGGEHGCGDNCKCTEEEVGFHKGALNTLAAERNELIKMIQNVEMIMQAHLKKLEEMGVKIEGQSEGSGQNGC